MKRYGWMLTLLVMTLILAAVPMSASAQCGGGQMDHNMMGSGHLGYGPMGYGYMGGYAQPAPGYTYNYGYDNTYSAAVPPATTYVPAQPEQTTGYQNHSGHDHNH